MLWSIYFFFRKEMSYSISNEEAALIVEEFCYGFDLILESRITLINMLNDNEESDTNKLLYTIIIADTISKCYETFFTILYNLLNEQQF